MKEEYHGERKKAGNVGAWKRDRGPDCHVLQTESDIKSEEAKSATPSDQAVDFHSVSLMLKLDPTSFILHSLPATSPVRQACQRYPNKVHG